MYRRWLICALLLGFLAVLTAVPALADGETWGPRVVRRAAPRPARGPIEVRDEWLLAQPRLTLPAVTPDPIPCRAWRVRIHLNWGNDFGFDQRGSAESPFADVRFLVDGEHRTLELGARYGFTPNFDVGVRIPVRCRGGGILDGVIDFFHETTGLKDNARPFFFTDRFRVRGRDVAFNQYAWDDGIGLGNVELEAHWAFLRSRTGCGLRAALVGRMGLPTGTEPFDTGSVDAGAQLVAAHALAPLLDLYGGVGATWFSDTHIDGFEYEEWRGQFFIALEYRPFRAWSFFVQGDYHSRLIANIVSYPGTQIYVHGGAKVDLSRRWQLELGFTENIEDQQSTIDFGIFFGLVATF